MSPSFHGIGYGWGSRRSATNYVYNHIGNFAAAQEAACRSLLVGGVPVRFPELRFAFLEGGVGWSAQLLADFLGHFEKRNPAAVTAYDPRRFDVDLAGRLIDTYGPAADDESVANATSASPSGCVTRRRTILPATTTSRSPG